MRTYYTKSFTDTDKIDEWLNNFDKAEASQIVIEGYVVTGRVITITVRVFHHNTKPIK